ncbi:MAG: hypothetical protein J3K34DRAFT_421763 [Monoraphidium minutum]|nr:MAG: hypothetical protein J3K34DRAFT_421763 [Monoraphidium minutum]
MATYSSSLELLEPLLGSQASVDDIAAAVVGATYAKASEAWAEGGDASAALTNVTIMSDLYARGYVSAQPAARRRAMRRLHDDAAALRSVEELKPLFDAVAAVVAATNTLLQVIVAAAKQAAAEGRTFDSMAALVQISAIAAVQQQDLAASISELAAKVAANPGLDIAAEAAALEAAYTGDALAQKIKEKVTGMPDIVDLITDQQGGLGQPPAPDIAAPVGTSIVTANIIAGTVVGFGVTFGLVVLALVLLHKRRAAAEAQAAAGKLRERYAAGDGGAPGPVAEAALLQSSARAYYQQRALRAQAALHTSSPEHTPAK